MSGAFPVETAPTPILCPYGWPGGRLWVRETWCPLGYEGIRVAEIPKEVRIIFRDDAVDGAAWRSPIYMPRWASRLTLEIQAVRVEQVQAISEADAIAEGCRGQAFGDGPNGSEGVLPLDQFQTLWDELNAARGFPWAANPYVWVIEFRVVIL